MKKNEALYPFGQHFDWIEHFLETLMESRMKYYASDIFNWLELETEEQFTNALEKTLNTLQKAGIPAEHHIMPVFSGDRQKIVHDYKFSALAFKLFCMQLDPVNEKIAQLQVEWMKKLT